MIHFDLPKEQSSILKVIGVGGGGGNAVNFMFGQQIDGVNFIICNTDAQALANSGIPNRIQLGPHLTQGLGCQRRKHRIPCPNHSAKVDAKKIDRSRWSDFTRWVFRRKGYF